MHPGRRTRTDPAVIDEDEKPRASLRAGASFWHRMPEKT